MTTISPAHTASPKAGLSAPAALPASKRDPRLDFYRGIAMFIILFAHTPGNFFTSWIPARWGFSDATEIFVFCSGMASAIAFGRTYDRAGWTLGTARVGFRVWQVYWAHIAMFFTIAMMLSLWDSTGLFDKNYTNSLNLVPFFREPAQNIIGLFTLTYVPNYFDILPMYLAILVMMPLVMALSRISVPLTFAVIATVWLFAQGRLLAGLGAEHMALNFPAEPWSAREWFFNPFGWQLIFFTGFAFMRGWIPAPPVTGWLIALAAVIVLANVPLSNIGIREFGFRWALEWRIDNKGWINKSDFGILRYVHFLALAYLAWVVAGQGGHRLMASGAGLGARIWDRVVTVIMKVGQQSLAVFVFSMVFARIAGFVLDQIGRSTLKTSLVNVAGIAALIAVAYFVAWIKTQPWRVRKSGAGAI
ncbi:MAG: OpgC domain-containing protein [Paracoccaceae bacterium]